MLGKLFNLTAGAGGGAAAPAGPSLSPEPVSSLDSVQEDAHTRNLLYPDADSLLQHRHDQVFPLPGSPRLPSATILTSAFDYDADLDLDKPDVRVLIMQDGLSSVPSCLLYDSQPPPPPPPPPLPPLVSSSLSSASTLLDRSSTPQLQNPARRGGPSSAARKPSLSHASRPLVIQPDSPQLRQSFSTFDQRPSLHARGHSRLEADGQRAYREYADELAVFSGCIFGNSELQAYRGTSTKVHILPSDAARPEIPPASSSFFHDGRGSLGRSSMRSSKLSQSFSSESTTVFGNPASSSSSSMAASSARFADRRRVLITRLFPVTLPNDEDAHLPGTPLSRSSHDAVTNNSASSATGYPFPALAEDGTWKKRKKAPLKQKRTPMYAVALVVSLPHPPAPPSVPASSFASRSTFRQPGSYTEQDAFPSSYNSGRRVGWSMASAAMGASDMGSDSQRGDSVFGTIGMGAVLGATTDLEERIDPVTQNWDIIMRTLTRMQTVVSATVAQLLRAADVSSPDTASSPLPQPRASRTGSFNGGSNGRRGDDHGSFKKPPKTNAKLVTLLPNALLNMDSIAKEAEDARARLVVGLRALRVVTGQNRWGIWREEARWVSRWISHNTDERPRQGHHSADAQDPGRDRDRDRDRDQQAQPFPSFSRLPQSSSLSAYQGDFLCSLLTAFLATHTDWLQALSPSRYRKRHMMLQNSKGLDDSLAARTIVVSHDKAAARRIVFLLSAFLPAAQSLPVSARVHRLSTSLSWSALSQSPPAAFSVPAPKEESLRRKINRRGPASGSVKSAHTRNYSLQGLNGGGSGGGGSGGSGSGIALRSTSTSVAGVPPPLAHLHMDRGQHERRPSDTASIRTASLPITGNDLNSRKNSNATTATVASEAAIPHFASLQRTDSNLLARPHSSASSSAAADDLKRTLRRGDSNSSQQSYTALSTNAPASPGMGPDARNQSSRWGTVLSGLLSSRRRDPSSTASTGHTRTPSASLWDPLGRRKSLTPQSPSLMSPTKSRQEAAGIQQAEQALRQKQQQQQQQQVQVVNGPPTETAAPMSKDSPQFDPMSSSNPRRGSDLLQHRMPDPSAVAFESAVKSSINAEDGVIDVDIPFPDYIRSFETAVSSPSSSGFLSTPGFGSSLDAFEQSYRFSMDGDLPANAAGWIQSYHPDLALQAIPPQADLLEQVRKSLRTEPLPAGAGEQQRARDRGDGAKAPWCDVATAIIVDLTKMTITRVHYSRRAAGQRATTRTATTPSTPETAASSPLAESEREEQFVEEDVLASEPVLAHAIERVVFQGLAGGHPGHSPSPDAGHPGHTPSLDAGHPGHTPSPDAGPSRAGSVRRKGTDEPEPAQAQPRAIAGCTSATPLARETEQEVPRAECKAVILSALEDIVREEVLAKESSFPTDSDQSSSFDGAEAGLLRSAVRAWLDYVEAATCD